jgi:endoglucanase
MRDIPSSQIVEEMHLGWNLGNTLDADPDETAWGNPPTTQAMMDTLQDAGFNTVRIPITWQHHMGGPPNYTVDDGWMDRVEEVVGYVLSAGMYAIVNSHHDEWVSLMPSADHDAVAERLASLWTQIATRFRDYDDHLVFETLNEPRTRDSTEWTGGTPEARQVLNGYNLAAVNAIRATGGNNTVRHIMVPTHAANPSTTTIEALQIPNDDPRIIVSLHTYYPNEFSMGSEANWGSSSDRSQMEDELDRIYNLLPANGRAVVIGEWGSINKNNSSARVDHAETYARLVRERGMCPVWWDNGASAQGSDGFGLLDREASPPGWSFPEIATALADGAEAGAGL